MSFDSETKNTDSGIRVRTDPTSSLVDVASETTLAKRHAGMFKPGISGNPTGRPKSDATIKELAKIHTEEAISTLVEVLRDKRAPRSAKVHAACALLDRGWGKPTQYLESANMTMTFSDYAAMRVAAGALEYRTVLDDLKVDREDGCL